MKYAVEMDSGAVTYIPSFVKIVSTTQKLMGGYTDTQNGDSISVLLFLKNKENRLK
jgi:hypothetical protein